MQRARRLSGMMALRVSSNADDARLERKLHFEYAKLKAKVGYGLKPYDMRMHQSTSAEATSVAYELTIRAFT